MGASHSNLVHAASEEAGVKAAELPVVETAAPTRQEAELPVPTEESSDSPSDSTAHASNPDSSSSELQEEEKEHASQEGAAAGEDAGDNGENLVQEEPEEEKEEEEEEQPKPKLTVEDVLNTKTAPFDIRFPSTNQTKHCYTRYIEYHKCRKERGPDAPECDKYARYYRSLCPSEWIERWNEQREMGVFPGPY
ncbi:cytochrome c oxidase subunit 6b-1 isoform X2 [Selaginella moellendorffii]|nr:cytochrome c oxidase subunit 6b-1 isoform X2 [Selaginella moellendorffii]|eukprot:XP_002965634.2 cytochrome c oxidase subunit 6b-1 isoform X2 [Selaginella moellendorffii]